MIRVRGKDKSGKREGRMGGEQIKERRRGGEKEERRRKREGQKGN